MKSDKLALDLDTPELVELFGRKNPGEKCVLKITGTLDEVANKVAVLSVVAADILPYESGEDHKEEAPSGPPQPVMGATDYDEEREKSPLE